MMKDEKLGNTQFMHEVIKDFKSTKAIVREILKQNERARNDDRWLIYMAQQAVAQKLGTRIYVPFDVFNQLPSAESIRRTRQKIQNEEMQYMPTDPETRKKRGIKEFTYKYNIKNW